MAKLQEDSCRHIENGTQFKMKNHDNQPFDINDH